MALGTLLALVTFGIALVMLVTHALGGSTTPPIGPGEAQAVFSAEHPTTPVRAVRQDVSGRIAVIFLDDERVAVVRRLGDHPAVRLAAEVTRYDADHLRVHFGDVGWPPLDVHLMPDSEEARDVRD
ncbi:MAG: hypothetical protein AAF211_02400 [Myxococcota bacterium]